MDSSRSGVPLSAALGAFVWNAAQTRSYRSHLPNASRGWEGVIGKRGSEARRFCRCLGCGEELGARITDDRRIAHLELKVESLDQSVADLRRSVEVLNTRIAEIRLEQIRRLVRSHGLAFEKTE